MSRATNRTSNISVTWNFKNPNISRNELINFIHLFREVPGYSREVSGYSREVPCYSTGLIRHCLAISAVSRYLCCLSTLYGLAVFVRRHISIFIFHRTPARKFPERLFSPSQRPPRSFPTTPPEISQFLLPLDISTASRSSPGAISPFSSFIGRPPESLLKVFPFRVSVLPKVSRLLHLKSRDSCYISISLRPRGLRQAPYLHFHQSPARKSPERLFSPSLRPPESFLTTPPEISRFPFGTKVIKILDLSPYLPPTRPFAVSPTLSYSPKPVIHQPRHPPESAPLIHQSPCTFYPHLTLSYNNTHQSSSSLPTITKFAFPTVHHALFSFSLAI